MALSNLSSVIRSKYKNVVGDYEISYDVNQNSGEKANNVLGNIKKGDLRLGYVNWELDGRKSITIEPGVPDEDIKMLVSTIIDDSSDIFMKLNN